MISDDVNKSTEVTKPNEDLIVYYYSSLAAVEIFCAVGAVSLAALLYGLHHTVLIPWNVKLLLRNTCGAALICVGYYGGFAFVRLCEGPTLQPVDPWSCMLQETPFTMALFVMFVSIPMIALERLQTLSTLTGPYRGCAPTKLHAVCLACLSWAIAVFLCSICLYFAYTDDSVYYYCANFLLQPMSYIMFLNCLFFLVNLTALFTYVALYRRSRDELENAALKYIAGTLKARFEIRRNVRITKMLLPTVACQAVVIMPSFVYDIYIHAQRRNQDLSVAIAMNILSTSVAANVCCFAVACILGCPPLQRCWKKRKSPYQTTIETRESNEAPPNEAASGSNAVYVNGTTTSRAQIIMLKAWAKPSNRSGPQTLTYDDPDLDSFGIAAC